MKTYKQLIKEADKYFSIWIRTKDADSNGMVACYTCKKQDHWKKMDCGHYISRKYLSTRYYEKNCKPQCKHCNVFSEGNKPAFAIALRKEYKNGILEELDQLSHISVKYSREKLGWMIESFKKQIKK